MKMKVKVCLCLILLTHFVVARQPSQEWRDISINLRRTIGSAYFAANILHVTFTNMISAQERINPLPNTNEYRVTFEARDRNGVMKHCKADVLWNWESSFVRTVSNEICWSPSVVADSLPLDEWRPVSILLKRAILAASTAAKYLEVEYLSLLKAWQNVQTQPPDEEYRVIFKARCQYGILKQCQAEVDFGVPGKITNAFCRNTDEETMTAY